MCRVCGCGARCLLARPGTAHSCTGGSRGRRRSSCARQGGAGGCGRWQLLRADARWRAVCLGRWLQGAARHRCVPLWDCDSEMESITAAVVVMHTEPAMHWQACGRLLPRCVRARTHTHTCAGGCPKVQATPAKLPWARGIASISASACSHVAAAVDSAGRLYTWGAGAGVTFECLCLIPCAPEPVHNCKTAMLRCSAGAGSCL
jgi:hypothetical protein